MTRYRHLITDDNRKWWTLGAMCFALFMIMLDNTVVNVALPSIQRDLQRLDLRAGVDDQRLHALIRRAARDRRAARRHLRPPPHVHPRRRHLRRLLGDGRPGPEPDRPGRQSRRPGRRRRTDDAGDALDRHPRVPAARARQSDGHLGRRLGPGARRRSRDRRPAHRARQLAGDLLPQYPGRDRRGCRRPLRGPRVPRHDRRPRGGLRRGGGPDRLADGADPRPGRGQCMGLGVDRNRRPAGRRRRSAWRPSSRSSCGSRCRWSNSASSPIGTSSARWSSP